MAPKQFPPRPDLDQLKHQAKELLRHQPLLGRLRDAQRAIAQQYGFASWDALRTHVESIVASVSDERVSARRGLTYDDTLPGDIAGVSVITPDSVRQLKEQNIRGVRIEQSVSPQTLRLLAQIATLRRIDLSGRADLVDRDVAFLEAMPWVTAISFARCQSIGDDGIAYLRNHQHLEEVNLQWSGTGDDAVSHLAGTPGLHRVALGARLTDAGVARLQEYPALRTPGADDSFVAISSSTALTDRSLASVGDLGGVVSLDVHYSAFGSRAYTAAGVAHLQRMTSLEELNFLGDLATDGVLRDVVGVLRPRLRDHSEHRGQDAHGGRSMAGERHEVSDFVEDLILVADKRQVVLTGKLHEPRSGNPRRQVTSLFHFEAPIAPAVNDQRRHLNGRQEIPDVDPGIHPGQRNRRAGARAHPQVRGPPFAKHGIGRQGRRPLLDAHGPAPLADDCFAEAIPLLARRPPRIFRCPQAARVTADTRDKARNYLVRYVENQRYASRVN